MLTAKARDLNQNATHTGDDCLMFDTPAYMDQVNSKCVIMAIQKGLMDLVDKRHYVLVVAPTDRFAANNTRVYERVGAGFLPGRCFSDDLVPANIE